MADAKSKAPTGQKRRENKNSKPPHRSIKTKEVKAQLSKHSKGKGTQQGREQESRKRPRFESEANLDKVPRQEDPRPQPSSAKSSSLLDKYKKKLEGAKFRLLNESLYTGEKSETGLSQSEFEIYHQGFSTQVSKWPTNPVDVIIADYLRPMKRKLTVGDFGCGDAKIAATVGGAHKVHSYDLVAVNDMVEACDIAKDGVPLPEESLDMVIFSLSLMGEEVSSYIKEARRVLKNDGLLIIAEVKSRFSDEGETTPEAMEKGLKRFASGLRGYGFSVLDTDSTSNTMFVLMRAKKQKGEFDHGPKIPLKSCEYKRR